MNSLTSRQDGSTDRLLHDFPTSNLSPALTPSSGLFVTLISYVDFLSPALAAKMAVVQTESPSPPSKVSDPEQIELGKPQFRISRLYSSSLVDSLAIRLSFIYKVLFWTYAAAWRVSQKTQGRIAACLGVVLALVIQYWAFLHQGTLG